MNNVLSGLIKLVTGKIAEEQSKGTGDYNAIVEGVCADLTYKLNYKFVEIAIPQEAGILNDGVYTYQLYGNTDFQTIEENGGKIQEVSIDSLIFCKGPVVSFTPPSRILEHPRAVIMRDGRVFVEQGEMGNVGYLKALHGTAVKTAGALFKNRKTSLVYMEAMETPGL